MLKVFSLCLLFAFLMILVNSTNSYAVDFKDHTGYIPEWALEIGEFQALMTCANMEHGSIDQKWCLEYSGYYNDKITRELEEIGNENYYSDQQNFDTGTLNSDYKPQFNERLFPDSKKITYDNLLYTNELYGFSINPPKNWSVNENTELLGGEEAAPVGFISPRHNPTYTSNFIIIYANMGSGYFDLLRLSSDNDLLNSFADGFMISDINSKVTSTGIQSYLDGYKFVIDSVHTLKLDEKKFATLQKESIVFIRDTGEMYALIFASNSDDYAKDVEVFRKSSETFHVGAIEFIEDTSKQNVSDDPICGTGTIEKNGRCVVDPNYPNPSTQGGCLIATATYGSELSPQVQQLRELRDSKLLHTEAGTSFMESFNSFYYSFSPYIADYERENPVFKEAVKLSITPMIASLSILNHVDMDSEAGVLGYGISLIILNLGMYVGIPIAVIIGMKKRF